MVITTVNNIILDTYYSQTGAVAPCNRNTKTRWGRVSPYDGEETIYWAFKHLTLPGIGVLIVAIILIVQLFKNPIWDAIVAILGISAVVFILSYIRELIRSKIYKIPNGEIKVGYDYSGENIEELFRIPLNTITEPKFKIGLVGDIMMLKKYLLDFDQEVIDFFMGVDIIIGNLEGIITPKNARIPKQRHENPPILDQLGTLLTNNTKWLLCLSNNHSIDFGNADFHDSLSKIQRHPKFDVFGRNDVPNVLIQNFPINIASGTEWSNQKNWDCTSIYKSVEINSYHCPDKFNILFPHWGYENEKYIRERVRLDSEALLTGLSPDYKKIQTFVRKVFKKKIIPERNKKWDFIFGHHSHVRQPIMVFEDELRDQEDNPITDSDGDNIRIKKLVAFSGGNFTSGANIIRKKKHIYGIIMKCEIGPLQSYEQKYAIGNVEWRRTINNKEGGSKRVSIDMSKYRTYNLWALILGLVFIGLFAISHIINLFIY